MAKFVFELQSILEIKEKLETQEKMLYATAQAQLYEEIDKLEGFKNKKLGYEAQMRENMQSGLNVQTLNECHHGIEIMKDAIKTQEVEVEKAQKRVDLARAKLNEAIKERKTYEKLRENAFEEFMQEINVQEGKEIDELVSYSYQNASGK